MPLLQLSTKTKTSETMGETYERLRKMAEESKKSVVKDDDTVIVWAKGPAFREDGDTLRLEWTYKRHT